MFGLEIVIPLVIVGFIIVNSPLVHIFAFLMAALFFVMLGVGDPEKECPLFTKICWPLTLPATTLNKNTSLKCTQIKHRVIPILRACCQDSGILRFISGGTLPTAKNLLLIYMTLECLMFLGGSFAIWSKATQKEDTAYQVFWISVTLYAFFQVIAALYWQNYNAVFWFSWMLFSSIGVIWLAHHQKQKRSWPDFLLQIILYLCIIIRIITFAGLFFMHWSLFDTIETEEKTLMWQSQPCRQ